MKAKKIENKTLTKDEFLNILEKTLPINDRSKLLECYPKKENNKGIYETNQKQRTRVF